MELLAKWLKIHLQAVHLNIGLQSKEAYTIVLDRDPSKDKLVIYLL
jgi:hypothetical protein